MKDVQVLIVGAGPIGLTAAILLKQQGIDVLVVDRKEAFDTHPRARFLDSCTLELFRQMGVADAVEATGIGPAWTETVKCFTTLSEEPIADVPSPEFHSVARPLTPQVPVMSSQDLVEPILNKRARALGVKVKLSQTFKSLAEVENGCVVDLDDQTLGEPYAVFAEYVIGCDGGNSRVRESIGCQLEGEVRDTFYRDVLFHADLDPWITDRGNQASLLWVAHGKGSGTYQPLDGKQRFRAQIAGLEPSTEYDDDFFKDWIKASLGTEVDLPIEIFSKLKWRVSSRLANQFLSLIHI